MAATEIMLEAIESVHPGSCFFSPRLAESVSQAMRHSTAPFRGSSTIQHFQYSTLNSRRLSLCDAPACNTRPRDSWDELAGHSLSCGVTLAMLPLGLGWIRYGDLVFGSGAFL